MRLTPEDELLLRYKPLVLAAVKRLKRRLPPSVGVDDLYQAGMLAVHLALPRYNPEAGASVETYLTTRVDGALIDELRAQDWLTRTQRSKLEGAVHVEYDDKIDSEFMVDLEDMPEAQVDHNQRIVLLLEEIMLLPEGKRELLRMVHDEALTHSEIGDLFGVTSSAISQRLATIYSQLALRMRIRNASVDAAPVIETFDEESWLALNLKSKPPLVQ